MNTILVVDDHPLVREGMKEMLALAQFTVAAASCGDEALALCAKKRAPDLVITDIRMPKMDGFELAARLRRLHPGTKVLMLAGMPLTHELERAKDCGASGYLPKSTPWRDLVAAIRAILSGAPFQEEKFTEERQGVLSPRETEILRWIAEGKTHEEISIICSIAVETIKSHCKNIRTKLDTPNIPATIRRAYELGILRP